MSDVTSKLFIRMLVSMIVSVSALALLADASRVSAQSEPSAQPAGENNEQDEKDAKSPDESVEKDATTQVKPGDAPDTLEPPREPTAADILKALTRPEDAPPRPVILPSQQGQTVRSKVMSPDAVPPNAVAPITPRLYPDGHRIVDRPGRLTREGDYYVFAFESRGRGEPELPIRLLPNRLLEDMEIVSAGGTRPVVFQISGELTEYHGANYLLVQKLLTRPELGNLK